MPESPSIPLGVEMRSTHEFAVTQAATAKMSKEPAWAFLTAEVCTRLNTNYYDPRHVDVIMQLHRGLFDLYDAFAFLQVHALIGNGTFVIADIPVGREPSPDKSIQRNRTLLGGLDKRFKAEFRGGLSDSDGFLHWHDDLYLTDVDDDGSIKRFRIPARRVPLEVGYTKGSRTLTHLTQETALARWPYGHDEIRLFVAADSLEIVSMGFPENTDRQRLAP